jgi:hypothetical protein
MKIEEAIAGVTEEQKSKSIKLWKSHYKSTRKYVITPDVARALLATQATNRRVRARRVVEYARAMAEGKWLSQTNQQIGVCLDGRLIDGQHRLLAVILNGKPMEMEITVGMPIEVQKVIDGACPRNAEDHTGIPSKYCCVYKIALLQAGFDVEYRCDWYLEKMHESKFGAAIQRTVDVAPSNRKIFCCRAIKLAVATASVAASGPVLENYRALSLQKYDEMAGSIQAFNRWAMDRGGVVRYAERDLLVRAFMAFYWVADSSKKTVALFSDKNTEQTLAAVKKNVSQSIGLEAK